MTRPKRVEIAWMVASRLPTYATPSSTTAGNSTRPPSGTRRTVLNGGRRWMCTCDCERDGVAPYIGHCRLGR